MKFFLDCLPCTLRQVLDASRMSTKDTDTQNRIMGEAIVLLERYGEYRNSPEMTRDMHGIVKKYAGVDDPYSEVKKRDISTALGLLPELREIVGGKKDRLYWALKVSATGNVLDSALGTGEKIHGSIEAELNRPFGCCDIEVLARRLETAKSVLIIGDNAGETVFDRVLIEELPQVQLTYAVRHAPTINDATLVDACASGLDGCAHLISTGCDVPGVLLDECSREFLDVLNSADVVIGKGQGNFETLSDCGRDMFFLLKAKCPVVAGLLGVDLNEYVLRYKPAAEKIEQ